MRCFGGRLCFLSLVLLTPYLLVWFYWLPLIDTQKDTYQTYQENQRVFETQREESLARIEESLCYLDTPFNLTTRYSDIASWLLTLGDVENRSRVRINMPLDGPPTTYLAYPDTINIDTLLNPPTSQYTDFDELVLFVADRLNQRFLCFFETGNLVKAVTFPPDFDTWSQEPPFSGYWVQLVVICGLYFVCYVWVLVCYYKSLGHLEVEEVIESNEAVELEAIELEAVELNNIEPVEVISSISFSTLNSPAQNKPKVIFHSPL